MAERTDLDVLSKKPIEVMLGDRVFSIQPRVRANSRKFRAEAGRILGGIDDLLDVIRGASDKTGEHNVSADKVITIFRDILFTKLDAVLDLIYLYDPDLERERDYIENNATDEQCMEAVIAIIGLVFRPFQKYLAFASIARSAKEKTPNTTNP